MVSRNTIAPIRLRSGGPQGGWKRFQMSRPAKPSRSPKARESLPAENTGLVRQAKPPPADPYQPRAVHGLRTTRRKAALGAIGCNQGLAEADATVSRGHFRMEVHLEGSFAQRAQKHPKEK